MLFKTYEKYLKTIFKKNYNFETDKVFDFFLYYFSCWFGFLKLVNLI